MGSRERGRGPVWRKGNRRVLVSDSHGERTLAGYSRCGCKELDTTEQLTLCYTTPLPASFVCLLVLLAFLSHAESPPVTKVMTLLILSNGLTPGAPISLPPFLGVTYPRSHSWR